MTLSSELRSVNYFGQDISIRLDGKEVWTDYPDTQLFYTTEDWEPGIAYEKGGWSGNEFFDCTAPRELKVEYAPYGSDTYTEAEYTEQPGKRFMPAYGNCYEASLAQVTRTSASGWYDLRFTITDNQGNTQQQTVSPGHTSLSWPTA